MESNARWSFRSLAVLAAVVAVASAARAESLADVARKDAERRAKLANGKAASNAAKKTYSDESLAQTRQGTLSVMVQNPGMQLTSGPSSAAAVPGGFQKNATRSDPSESAGSRTKPSNERVTTVDGGWGATEPPPGSARCVDVPGGEVLGPNNERTGTFLPPRRVCETVGPRTR
jgi:hypothetical protein